MLKQNRSCISAMNVIIQQILITIMKATKMVTKMFDHINVANVTRHTAIDLIYIVMRERYIQG